MTVESALIKSELRYRRLFETAQDGILILDAGTGAIIDVNPFLTDMLGYSRAEFIKRRLWEVGAFKDIKANQEAFKALQKNKYIRYENLPLRAKDGRLVQVEFVSNEYLVGEEKVIQCNIRDITDRVQAQKALEESEALLRELSVRDHLTNLFNRRFLEETLEREILQASRKHLSISIIMLDVDNFKAINDTHGHAVGDTILRELGILLKEHVRGGDVACRYGGDEFILVLLDVSHEATEQRAILISQFATKIHLRVDGKPLDPISLSIGIAFFPDHGSTCDVLLKAADKALFHAKHQGRGIVVTAK
jgi:diguanylate cyclase (GGDEF)-like protein/PAS domain S-box-containing protein